jgi:hypothetical protein
MKEKPSIFMNIRKFANDRLRKTNSVLVKVVNVDTVPRTKKKKKPVVNSRSRGKLPPAVRRF